MSEFELVTLRSGERAVRSLSNGETMHPTGPWAEANRLYVRQSGLEQLLFRPGPPLRIYDVGLGAATNAVAALTCARSLSHQARMLEVVSFERDLSPLTLAMGDAEGFPFLRPFEVALQALRSRGLWEEEGIRWSLLEGDFLGRLSDAPSPVHLIFFDPFSPKSNPELWSPRAFTALHPYCDASPGGGCQLFTYSAATPTRAVLLLGGFFVGAGDSTGSKGETTVAATRLEDLAKPLTRDWLNRWERSSRREPALDAALRAHPQFQLPR